MVIVTRNQYLLASKIHHIVMNEHIDYLDVRTPAGRISSVKNCWYNISIIYSPETTQQQAHNGLGRNEEIRECVVNLRTAKDAHKVFRDLIQQIREQMPDQLYLDTALERMIGGVDIKELEERDLYDSQVLEAPKRKRRSNGSNSSTTKVRPIRKAKRRNQKVLRPVKRSNR